MEKRDFNRHWIVSTDESSMLTDGRGSRQEVTLPYDAMIHEERSRKSPAAGACGYYPGKNYVYEKSFSLQEEDRMKRILLEFEGIYHRARVYVNGAYVTACHNGYRGFYADLTPHLNADGENTVQVRVMNADSPNARWYTGSGIYRPVYMLLGEEIYIQPSGVRIRALDAAEDISAVEIVSKLGYDGRKREELVVHTELLDPDGKVAVSEDTKVTLYEGVQLPVRQRMYVRGARLWSVENPDLYTCVVELRKDGKVLDSARESFGIRKLQLDPMYGLRVNGKSVLLRGACIHHDNGVIGAASFTDAELRKIRRLKEAGFNAVRMSHNSASKEILEACDRVGMLVIDEAFDMWNQSKSAYDYATVFAGQWEQDIEAVVEKDFNHPSVIFYSVGNEIQELGTQAGAFWNRRLTEKFKSLDDTRYVTNAVNGLLTMMDRIPEVMCDLGLLSEEELQRMASGGQEQSGDVNDVMTMLMGNMNTLTRHHSVAEKLDEVFSALDVCGYNYMRERYETDAAAYPNRMTYGSETCGPDIDLNWDCVKRIPNTIGDFTWTGWDYIGEAGIGMVGYDEPGGFASPYPTFLAYTGDIDVTGVRRPASYYREIVWGLRKEPYIAVLSPEHYGKKVSCTPWVLEDVKASWTWPQMEGRTCRVVVYAAQESVELYLNGRKIGAAEAGPEHRYRAVFELPYEPGVLEARAGDGTGNCILQTAGDRLHLQAEAERSSLKGDGSELAYLNLSLLDENGILMPAADRPVSVSIEGSGELAGFGSGNPRTEESFCADTHMTWNGTALAVIRGTGRGRTAVRIKAEGLPKETIYLEML